MVGNAAPAADAQLPEIVEANDEEVVYEIMFDLPDAGLKDDVVPPDVPIPADAPADIPVHVAMAAAIVADVVPEVEGQQYPTGACRSAVGNQPYDTFSPRMTFLQLREAQAHRSVLDATKYVGLTKNKQLHASMGLPTGDFDVYNTEHTPDPELWMDLKVEIKVWAYMMTQINLKPGLCKFGARGVAAAVKELAQLHIMDTWRPMDPSKLG